MANKYIQIPISDHDTNCSIYYLVEYKLSTDTGYNSFNWATAPPIKINNVIDDSTYDVRITRFCCDGSQSAPLVLSIDTTTNSPQLAAPTGLALTPGVTQLAADCNNVVNATEYLFELAKDSDFTVEYQIASNSTSDYTFTGLDTGVLYYCRCFARASGYQDSPVSSTVSGTPS